MKKIYTRLFSLTALVLLASCSGHNNPSNTSNTSIETSSSANTSSVVSSSSSNAVSSSSKKVSSSSAASSSNELRNSSGLVVKFKNTGATIDSITWGNTKLASDGFTVGRVANRIAGGKFTLNGTQYSVSKNDGNNSLHGGTGSGMNSWRGPFATKDWTKVEQTETSIKYKIVSADNENGYPGEMTMYVTYTLNEESELSIDYSATSTKDTLCNPTNHVFFTINGNNSYDNVTLQIKADNYTPLNSSKIPTGEIASVIGTKYDYTSKTAFRKNESYDDNYVLDGTGYRKVATMIGETTGVRLDVYTDRPGLQLYKENNGKICLETQMLPDSINQPNFADYGSTILRAGETFTSKTTYAFSKAS